MKTVTTASLPQAPIAKLARAKKLLGEQPHPCMAKPGGWDLVLSVMSSYLTFEQMNELKQQMDEIARESANVQTTHPARSES